MTPFKINRKYRPRILAILNKVAELLRSHKFQVVGPTDMADDTYAYSLFVKSRKIDIRFTICESEHWDGEKGGVSFQLDITEFGGRVLGGFCPLNYTDKVWVSRKDKDAVEERFKLMERMDITEIVNCCTS